MHLEHGNLTVRDVDSAIDFYRRVLGFHVRCRGTTTAGRPAAHVGDDRCYLALFQGDRDDPGAQDYDRVGFNHVGFVVDDIDEVKTRLESLGITLTGEADYEPGRRFYFRDPEGIEVEIVHYENAGARAPAPTTSA